MDVAMWMKDNVISRYFLSPSDANEAPAIVMKVDIEGSDEGVLLHMFSLGILCYVDFVYTEKHVRHQVFDALVRNLTKAGCRTHMALIDDEYYRTWTHLMPLPL